MSQLLAVRGTLWHGKICEASLITFIFVTMALVEKRDSFINALDGNNGVYASICGFLGGFGAWTVSMLFLFFFRIYFFFLLEWTSFSRLCLLWLE